MADKEELNFKLPEIHFSDDDDDDDTASAGANIRIFSRPTLGNEDAGDFDISFLDDPDAALDDWAPDEAIGEPSGRATISFPEPARDVATVSTASVGASVTAELGTQATEETAEAWMFRASTVKKYASAGTSTDSRPTLAPPPLPPPTTQPTRPDVTLLKLGEVADLELSRALDQLRLPTLTLAAANGRIDRDALSMGEPALVAMGISSSPPAPDTERNEELMRQLSEHSLIFSGGSQRHQPPPTPPPLPKPPPPPQQQHQSRALDYILGAMSPRTTTTTNASTATVSSSSGSDAMTDRVLQAMAEAARRPTVRVDLRHSQAAGLQMSDLLRFGMAPPADDSDQQPASSDDDGSSSGEDDDVEGGRGGGGLWLDSYRQAKRTAGSAPVGNSRQPAAKPGGKASAAAAAAAPPHPKVNGLPTASTASGAATDEALPATRARTTATTTLTAGSEPPQTPPCAVAAAASPSDELEKKLEAMRQRESELSRRRSLYQTLLEASPSLAERGFEPVFHEDVTFSATPEAAAAEESLAPIAVGSENLLLLEAALSPSYQLLGPNGQPLDVADTDRDLSYHCLLAWLLSLARDRPQSSDPFHVLGLRQVAATAGDSIRLQVAVRANQQLMPLHRFLAGASLRQLCAAWANEVDTAGRCFISEQPLSSVLSVNQTQPGQSIARDQPSMFWRPLLSGSCVLSQHWPPCSLPMETSVVELNRELFQQPRLVLRLLRAVATAARCDIAGARLVYERKAAEPASATSSPTFALAVRGCGAVAALRGVASGGSSVFEGHRDGWSVSRYPESAPRDLARFFGGRLSPKTTASQARALAPDRASSSSSLASVASLLTAPPLEDMAMLASPLVSEIGWVLHLAGESGFALIGCRRVQLQQAELASQLGMAESQAACYASGVGCVLLLRRENAVHHAGAFIQAVVGEIRSRRPLNAPPSLLFFAMPYLSAVMQAVHCTRIDSLPKLKTDGHQVEEPSFPDQEQLAVLLVVGSDFQSVAAQLLDQMAADFELLGLKCLPRMPQLHAHFVAELLCEGQLQGQSATPAAAGAATWRAAKPLMELPALAFVVRGVQLMERLRQLVQHYPPSRDFRVLHTETWHQAYCLTRNLFADFELFECRERRRAATACPPPSPTETEMPVLQQLRHPGPDRVETRTLLLLRGPPTTQQPLQHQWLLRSVARAARLVAKDAFQLDWLGLLVSVDSCVLLLRLARQNSVAALAALAPALAESLPARVTAEAPADWSQLVRTEERLGMTEMTVALTEIPPPSTPQADGSSHLYAVNPSPSAASASDATALLWRPPLPTPNGRQQKAAAAAASSLNLLARLCDLLHRRGASLIGCRTVDLGGLPANRCAAVGRDLRLRCLAEGSAAEATLTPGIYFVLVLEGSLISLGLRGYLGDPSPPDTNSLLPLLGPQLHQCDGSTAGAVHLANLLGVKLLPSDLVVYPSNAE